MAENSRLKLRIRGVVQGVGFRPFVFRLASELQLRGWVTNSNEGVLIEVEGTGEALRNFLLRIEKEKPPRSFIQSLESSWLDPAGYSDFTIKPSESGGSKTALVLPDISTCPDCLQDITEPNNRRYYYPFTNCTNCGPRFSIIEALPYDRANTSMKGFEMCAQCHEEYRDPSNRRFHAQPNACPVCGPHIELWEVDGTNIVAGAQAPTHTQPGYSEALIRYAATALLEGKILALKGLGGFHLMVAANDPPAVTRLRERKHREEKPLALMFPSLRSIRNFCEVSDLEERLLLSPESPIVLLRRLANSRLPEVIAPGNPNYGVMLPYSPLHHLLLAQLGFPVVATSGNLSDEPICINEREALERLKGIADLFLVHNRPIVRHVDDSIIRIIADRESVMRRARGYAPLPVSFQPSEPGRVVLGVGAHLKNTVALSVGSEAFVSQHIGDLETDAAYEAFRKVTADLEKLYESKPSLIVCDTHPDYLSTKFAQSIASPIALGLPAAATGERPGLLKVQHHVAHILACMAENELAPPVLGVSWDGTGYGLDGTVWGGEFFVVSERECERAAHFRQFRLPGGEKAVKEPRRTALGLLYEIFGPGLFEMRDLTPVKAFSNSELRSIKTMLAHKVNSPQTSSAGRLFDAVASLIDLRQQVRFEGQAAMELEFETQDSGSSEAYDFPLEPASADCRHSTLNWQPVVEGILRDLRAKVASSLIATRFHNSLVEGLIAVARRANESKVLLSGGCFQNRYLTERSISRLQEEGFQPYWHQRVPPNDGGISLGQIVAAQRQKSLAS